MEQTKTYKTYYAGSDWLEKNLPFLKPGMELSPLGRKAADLLGELFQGIYHIDDGQLAKVDWSNNHWIEIVLFDSGQWGTYDFDGLTRLVFLAHEMNVKAAICAAAPRWLRLKFHNVTRAGFFRDGHPTLGEARARWVSRSTLEVQE